MKIITKEEAAKMYGYYHSKDQQVLANSETGYCPETKTLVVCCGNCGDYEQIDLSSIFFGVEMMTRKDSEKIAEIIHCHADTAYGFIVTKPFVEHLADYLAITDPRFNREKFLTTCRFSS